jgi:hypothetical protein
LSVHPPPLGEVGKELSRSQKRASAPSSSLETFDWSALGGIGDAGATGDAQRIRELICLGFQQINLTLPPDSPDRQWLPLEEMATLVRSFQ